MKKILFISSCLIITLWGLKLPSTPVSAKTSFLKQSNNSTRPSPIVQPQVNLLNAGTEPRQELRFKPVVNAKQTATMTMNMDMAISVAGETAPQVKIPATVFTMQMVVTKVDANGDIHYQFSYTNADVVAAPTTPPKQIEVMRSQIKKIIGTKGSAVVDNRGRTKTASFVFPNTLDTNMKQQMEQLSNSLGQLSSPVPEQAIGIGAKWQISSSPKLGGMNLTQIATYQLVSRQDNVAVLDVNLEQHARQQNFTPPGLPTGALTYDAQGQGHLTQRLNQMMPISSTVSMHSNTQFDTRLAGRAEATTIGTKLFTNLAFQSQ